MYLKKALTLFYDGQYEKAITYSYDVDDIYPAVSHNGNLIAFTRTVGELWQIFIMNKDGSDVRQLTSSEALNAYPTFSHDGKQIFYESKAGGDWRMCRINIDGSNDSILTSNEGIDDWHPSCSPADALVYYESGPPGDENILAMDYSGENIIKITDDNERNRTPHVSYDGEKIVFTRYEETGGQLFIINTDGSGLQQITNMGGRSIHPAFSPDGMHIAFDNDKD